MSASGVKRVPACLDPHACALRHRVLMPVLDDVEQFAVGAVFQGGGIGEIDNRQVHSRTGRLLFVVEGFAVKAHLNL